MRIADVQLAFPFILLAIAIIAVLGPNLQNIIIVMGITGWVIYARVVRAEVLSLREKEYILAVRALGGRTAGSFQTPLSQCRPSGDRHRNSGNGPDDHHGSGLELSRAWNSAADPDLGRHAGRRRVYISTSWWLATFPGLVIMLVVLGINLLGNWLRDILDPRLTQL